MNKQETHEEIYKKAKEYYFGEVKTLRNQWAFISQNEHGSRFPQRLFDVGGSEEAFYTFLMKQYDITCWKMMQYIVLQLLDASRIKYERVHFSCTDLKLYKDHSLIKVSNNNCDHDEEQQLTFFTNINKIRCLLVFKRFGIGNRLEEPFVKELHKQYGKFNLLYISDVEERAYSEILNHNEDLSDPTRGTDTYSIRFFITLFFGKKEYECFKSFQEQFTKDVKDYFGISIVRSLKPNVMHNYRQSVSDKLQDFKYDDYINGKISPEQWDLIKNKYLGEHRYNVLCGASDFAESFMTAEWLFDSLKNAENVDLTAISMGYFKAIEQCLFDYIALHTYEKDSTQRLIYTGNKYSKDGAPQGYDYLTDATVKNKKKYITIAALIRFLGDIDKQGNVESKNPELLFDFVDQKTYETIIRFFLKIAGLRNGYFHKDNINDWQEVKKDRNTAYMFFILLFGAYQTDEKDLKDLRLIRPQEKDDYCKLCAYINNSAYADGTNRPVFFLEDHTEKGWAMFACPDKNIKYDIYGEPIYSQIEFRQIDPKQPHIICNRDHLPKTISEGTFSIVMENGKINFNISDPTKTIFVDGKFIF